MLNINRYAFLLSFLLLACNNNHKNSKKEEIHTKAAHNNMQEIILDKIESQSFVKKSNTLIDSVNKVNGNGRGSMSFIIDTINNENEFYVRAGNNREDRFETFYHFYVTAKPLRIRIYDISSDSIIPVEDYIKNQKD
jgi:hypothetical protein